MTLYLFGFVDAGRADVSSLPTFAPTEQASSVEAAGVVAVVVPVDVADFVGPDAETRLADLGWIAPRAVRHQDVLASLHSGGSVFPAPFGTLFSGGEALRAFLECHAPTILAFLKSVEGLSEWGVKGFLDVARAEERLLAEALRDSGDIAAWPPGRRYLEERRMKADAGRRVRPWLEEVAASLADRFAPLGRSAARRNVHPGTGREEGEETVLSWAFLVDGPGADRLASAVMNADAELSGSGMRLSLSGPWPPYSFCPDLPGSSPT